MNTDALTERIARALARQDGYDPDKHCDEWIMYGMRESAAAVLPIIAAEVRAAKAEALRSAARDIEVSDGHLPGMTVRDVYRGLRFRADDMETGGSDEHR